MQRWVYFMIVLIRFQIDWWNVWKLFYSQYDFPFVKARFQNIYGQEILGAGWRGTINTIWRNVTPIFIWKAIHNEELSLDAGGETSRDFIFVEDVVRGLICCALKGNAGESYNLASGVETKIKTLAKSIIKITSSKSELILQPNRRPWDHSGNRFGSTKKSKNWILRQKLAYVMA